MDMIPTPKLPTVEEKLASALTVVFNWMFIDWDREKGTRDGLHASSVLQPEGEYCLREHILGIDFRADVKEMPVSTLRKFLHGWLIHEKWQMLFQMEMNQMQREAWILAFEQAVEAIKDDPEMRELYEAIHEELVLKEKWRRQFKDRKKLALETEEAHYVEEYHFAFTPDAIILEFGLPFIVEIKGYRMDAYEHMLSLTDYMDDPDFKKAALQANLYMAMTGIEQAIILIENKNNQNYFLAVRKYDEALAKPYIKRLNEWITMGEVYRQTQKFPPRLELCENPDGKRAKSCPMRAACFASRAGREQYRKGER